tara:strand:- start:293 stop:469 length:177 start_codon:yes stop_codon:yes gene_type:complete
MDKLRATYPAYFFKDSLSAAALTVFISMSGETFLQFTKLNSAASAQSLHQVAKQIGSD